MAELSKQALKVENNTEFPNNNAGLITPAKLRTFNEDMIDSLVDEISYAIDSASFNQQLNALEEFTASATSLSTGSLLITASAVTNIMTFTKGDGSTFNVTVGSVIPAGTISGSSQVILQQTTGNLSGSRISGPVTDSVYAVSASSVPYSGVTGKPTLVSGSSQIVLEDTTFTDGLTDQFLTTDGAGNLSFDWVKTLHQNIHNHSGVTIYKGTPLYVSGSTGDNANVYLADASATNRRPATLIAGDVSLAPDGTGTGLISGEIQGVDTNLYSAGTIVYLGIGGGWTATRPTGSANLVQALGVVTRQSNNGRGVIFNQIGNNLPNIAEGYTWVGDSNGYPQSVATSSFSGGGTIDTSSFATTGSNTFEGNQQVNGWLDVTDYIATDNVIYTNFIEENLTNQGIGFVGGGPGFSFNNNVDITGSLTASLQNGYAWVGNSEGITTAVPTSSFGSPIDTSSFATTGSNTFTGNQIVSLSGGEFRITNPDNPQYGYVAFGLSNASQGGIYFKQSGSLMFEGAPADGRIAFYGTASFGKGIQIGQPESYGNNLFVYQSGSRVVAGGPYEGAFSDILVFGQRNTGTITQFTNVGVQIDKDLTLIGGLTASMQEGYVWAGGAGNISTLVATSSFGTSIDTSSFAILNNSQQFTGNNTFVGNTVTSASVSYGTASFNAPMIINNGIVGNVDITGSAIITNNLEVKGYNAKLGPFQYGSYDLYVSDNTNPGDVWGGYTLNNYDASLGGGFAISPYSELNQMGVSIYGGGNNTSGSSTIFAAGFNNGNIGFYKDNNIFYHNVEVVENTILNNLTASLAEGYVWVGDSSGKTTLAATSSFGGGGSIDTGSFATTGSNDFYGNEVFSGSVTISTNTVLNLVPSSSVGGGAALRIYTKPIGSSPEKVLNLQPVPGISENLVAISNMSSDTLNQNNHMAFFDLDNQKISFTSELDIVTQDDGTVATINLNSGDSSSILNVNNGLEVNALGAGNGITINTGQLIITGSVRHNGNIINEGNVYVTGSGELYATNNAFVNNDLVVSSGMKSEGYMTLTNAYPSFNLQTNYQGSGSAYTIAAGKVDNTTDPTNVYSAWMLIDDVNNDALAIAFNSYTGLYANSTAVLSSPGYLNGTDTAFGFPSNQIDVWKPMNVKDVLNLAPLDPLPAGTLGDLAVSGSHLYFHNGTAWGNIN